MIFPIYAITGLLILIGLYNFLGFTVRHVRNLYLEWERRVQEKAMARLEHKDDEIDS